MKIEPANIGVGLYQHDVKAKHLQTSLDEVVESCVNYVGVDVNTASPALLRYVSGMNQLTARRVYEHRREHGPFRNRAAAQGGARLGRGDVRPGGRLFEDRRRRQPAGRHLDSPGKLCVAVAGAGAAAARGRPTWATRRPPPRWPSRSPRWTWRRWPRNWRWAR